MRVNRATCRCGSAIYERSLSDTTWEWAHVDPFAPHDKTLCPDGLTALPLSGSQSNPRSPIRSVN